MCSHTDAAPGPPLNTKVTGRRFASVFASWYAIEKSLAVTSPFSFFISV